jgi:CubicO group peptidase (beta-lactamase class C family)
LVIKSFCGGPGGSFYKKRPLAAGGKKDRDYDKEGHIKDHKDTKEALAIFSDFDLVAEPGTRYQYSSYGFNLLGAVIEGASGQSYGDYLKEHIFDPLGMKNSLAG